MLIRIWQFRPHPDKVPEFQSVYGSRGAWATLFRRSPGFVGTELLQSTSDPNLYVTVDRWEDAASWDAFKQTFSEEYASLDDRCESLTVNESEIGTFHSPAA
jgi:heme-degrading monooxygenase HmoA